MKIRHLILTDSFAGAEQHVCVLANEQAQHGHEVEVWGGEPEAMRHRLVDVPHREAAHVVAAVRLARSTGRPDVLHAHMTKAEMAASLMSFGGRTPVVTTRHFAAVRGQSLSGHLARPFLRRRMSAQMAVSQFVAARIDGPSDVVYAGVATPSDGPSLTRDNVVLVAQRLAPEKRTADALRAFAASGLGEQDWELHIAGRGQEEAELRRLTAELHVRARVRFLGFTEDLPRRLSTAAIVLATAPAEPFGLTVVEAMAHATPVIATASAGHLESVGLVAHDMLFSVGDVVEAGEMLARLAADETLRTKYGAALRTRQRARFTPEQQYLDTQQIYERVLSP